MLQPDKKTAIVHGHRMAYREIGASAILSTLSETDMNAYRAPYLEPGKSRRPTLSWPRQIPSTASRRTWSTLCSVTAGGWLKRRRRSGGRSYAVAEFE